MKKYLFLIVFLLLQVLIYSENFNYQYKDINQVIDLIKNKKEIEQIVILEMFIANNHNIKDLYILKANIELRLKDYQGAIFTLESAIKKFPDDIDLLSLAGISQYNLSNYQESEKYFNKVISLDPKNSLAMNYLNLSNPYKIKNIEVSNTNEEDKNKTIPDDIKKLNESLDASFGNSDYVYLCNNKKVEVIDDKNYNYSIYAVIKVINNNGVKQFLNVSYPFNAFENTAEVEFAGIYDENYKYTGINKNNIIIIDKNGENSYIYSNKKFITFPVSELKPNSILEIKINFKTTGKNTIKGIFDQFIFASGEKYLTTSYTINYPKDRNFKILTKGVGISEQENKVTNRIEKTFSFKNPPVFNLKNETASIYDVAPQVLVTDFTSWNDISINFTKLYNDKIKGSKTGTDILTSLKISGKTKAEIIDSIYKYIQKNIRYNAIELGEGALIPNKPDDVIKNKFGDCKDQAILFTYLLNLAGVKAFPSLLSTENNGNPDKNIPSPYYFNHVIVYIPVQNGVSEGFFLDTTSPVTTFDNLPYPDQGCITLLINNGEGNPLMETPVIPYNKNTINEQYIIDMDLSGNASVNYTEKMTGAYAEMIRSGYYGKSPDEIGFSLYTYYKKNYEKLNQSDLKVSGFENNSGNIDINIKAIEQGLSTVFFDGRQKISFSLKDIESIVNIPKGLKFDYELNYLLSVKKTYEYNFPQGYKISSGEMKDFTKENEYVYFNMSVENASENSLKVSYEMYLKKRIIKNEDITNVISFIYSIGESNNYEVFFENDNLDYIAFYDGLLTTYKQKDIYDIYIRKLIELKQFDKALLINDKAIDNFPNEISLYLSKATIHYYKEDFKNTETALLQALDHNGNNVDVYYFLFDLFQKTKDDKKYEKYLLEAKEKFPKDESIINEIVTFYSRLDKNDKALSILNEAIKIMPENSSFYARLGYIYSVLKDFDNAEKAFFEAIKLKSDNSIALNNLAWLYCENNKKIKEAIGYALKACELEPYNDGYLDTLAEAYYQDGQYDPALDTIKKAIKINPNLTYFNMQQEKIEKAKKEKK